MLVSRWLSYKKKRYEAEIKEQLKVIVRRGMDSSFAPTAAAQERAKEACIQTLAVLKKSEPDRLHIGEVHRERFGYLHELSELWIALQKRSWTGACNALVDLIHFNSVTRLPVRQSVIRVLETALKEDEVYAGTIEEKDISVVLQIRE